MSEKNNVMVQRPGAFIRALMVWSLLFSSQIGCRLKEPPKPSVETPPLPAKAPGKQEKNVTLSVGITVEPYVIRAGQSSSGESGFEVDIVKEAFSLGGYDVAFVHEPLQRTKTSFLQKRVDGVMDVKDNYPEIEGSFMSDEYIAYYNFAVSLKSSDFEIVTFSDLVGKKVLAFQQAKIALGKDFKAMADSNPNYSEMANQENQTAMLFAKRVDVIVLDRRIFEYHRNRLTNVPTQQAVTYHELFKPSSFKIAFRDKELRDIFNAGYAKTKESGRCKEIIDSYVKNMKTEKSLQEKNHRHEKQNNR
ncbi:MAG: ABC transporter substrate-binding protein [Proteobacteria bacterium]|nr:ABC transporter substrate-binding protein [Pseudomonadota bacterium]